MCFCAFFSCDDKENQVIINVEEEFSIRIYEALEDHPRGIIMEIASVEEYECLDASLACELDDQSQPNNIILQDVLIPEDCLVGASYPSCAHKLDVFEEGKHFIGINIKDVNNIVCIEKLHDEYELNFETDHGIASYQTKLKSVPENLIWGIVKLQDENQGVSAFFEKLESDFLPASLVDANYGHFIIDNGEFQIISTNPIEGPVLPFIYEYESMQDLEEFRGLWNNFKQEYGDDLRAEVYTSNGLEI